MSDEKKPPPPQVKNPKGYQHLRNQGNSKASAAKIANWRAKQANKKK